MHEHTDTTPSRRQRPKKRDCRWDGCGKQFRVAPNGGTPSKYCKKHRVLKSAIWGSANLRKCVHPGCGATFRPLSQLDKTCEAHSIPPDTRHLRGTCAKCGKETRLYSGSPWCRPCLKRPPTGADDVLMDAADAAAVDDAIRGVLLDGSEHPGSELREAIEARTPLRGKAVTTVVNAAIPRLDLKSRKVPDGWHFWMETARA